MVFRNYLIIHFIIATVFLIIGPLLIYIFEDFLADDIALFYSAMAVPPEAYFSLVLPSLILSFIFLWHLRALVKPNMKPVSEINWKFFLAISLFGVLLPGQMGWLFMKLLVISLYYILTRKFGLNRMVFIASHLMIYFLISGILGQPVIWSILILLSDKDFKWPFIKIKLVILIPIVMTLLFLSQIWKINYRELYWNDKGQQIKSLEISDLTILFKEPTIGFPVTGFILITRLNHGQFLAKVLYNNETPLYKSELPNVLKAILASFVPRFLWENKPRAGGIYNAEKYIGDYDLADSGYSYNVGMIGETFGDFGKMGVIWYPILLAFVFIAAIAASNNFHVCFSPFFFYNILLVENDFLGAFNTISTSFVFLGLVFILNKLIK